MKKQALRKGFLFGLLVIVALFAGGCAKESFVDGVDNSDLTITVETYINERAKESEAVVSTVNLLAVGDNLIHSGIYKSGMKDDGTYNYDHLYQYVKDDIQAADLAIINQETIFIADHNNLSSYPCFGSPVEIGDAAADAGFDIVTHATNHVFDKGVQGITDTLNFWQTEHPEITVLGIHGSQADADTIQIVTRNGIRMAMLNYTYGMNGFTLPEDQPYLVDLLDKDKVAADIQRAKSMSDVVIFFMHNGTEYVYEPDESSKQWVNFLLEQGVDIAIDSHPHVLEPYTKLTRADGHEMVVYYSMGNFISTQDAVPRLLGGMAKLTIEKRTLGSESTIKVTDYTMEPLVMHWNHSTKDYAVYKLADYTDELAAAHGIHGVSSEKFDVQTMKDLFDTIMNTTVNPAQGVLQ